MKKKRISKRLSRERDLTPSEIISALANLADQAFDDTRILDLETQIEDLEDQLDDLKNDRLISDAIEPDDKNYEYFVHNYHSMVFDELVKLANVLQDLPNVKSKKK